MYDPILCDLLQYKYKENTNIHNLIARRLEYLNVQSLVSMGVWYKQISMLEITYWNAKHQ